MTAGLATGGVALGTLQLFASEPPNSLAEREVSAFISRYGSSLKVTRDRSRRSTGFKVKVQSVKRFAKSIDPQRLPFERIHVSQGNNLSFKHRGVDFTIINVA